MSTERARLLALLPRVYQRDPASVVTFALGWAGGGGSYTAEVDGHELRVVGTGTAPSATIALTEGVTLDDLVRALRRAGIIAAVMDDAAAVLLAGSLVDTGGPVVPFIADFEVDLQSGTSPVWRLADTFARALERASERIDAALAQLNLLDAAGHFADYWGSYTGTPREASEADTPYTARQVREVLRRRDNNEALAALIEEDTGITVSEVRDLRRDVFVLSRTPLRTRYLAGWRYNAAVCEVRVEDFPTPAVSAAARANIAAGITLFLAGQLGVVSGLAVVIRLRGLTIGEPAPLEIGVVAVGIGRIDGEE